MTRFIAKYAQISKNVLVHVIIVTRICPLSHPPSENLPSKFDITYFKDKAREQSNQDRRLAKALGDPLKDCSLIQ